MIRGANHVSIATVSRYPLTFSRTSLGTLAATDLVFLLAFLLRHPLIFFFAHTILIAKYSHFKGINCSLPKILHNLLRWACRSTISFHSAHLQRLFALPFVVAQFTQIDCVSFTTFFRHHRLHKQIFYEHGLASFLFPHVSLL